MGETIQEKITGEKSSSKGALQELGKNINEKGIYILVNAANEYANHEYGTNLVVGQNDFTEAKETMDKANSAADFASGVMGVANVFKIGNNAYKIYKTEQTVKEIAELIKSIKYQKGELIPQEEAEKLMTKEEMKKLYITQKFASKEVKSEVNILIKEIDSRAIPKQANGILKGENVKAKGMKPDEYDIVPDKYLTKDDGSKMTRREFQEFYTGNSVEYTPDKKKYKDLLKNAATKNEKDALKELYDRRVASNKMLADDRKKGLIGEREYFQYGSVETVKESKLSTVDKSKLQGTSYKIDVDEKTGKIVRIDYDKQGNEFSRKEVVSDYDAHIFLDKDLNKIENHNTVTKYGKLTGAIEHGTETDWLPQDLSKAKMLYDMIDKVASGKTKLYGVEEVDGELRLREYKAVR